MTLQRSFLANYFSLDDIMMTQELVPCTTLTPIERLGFLVPGNDKDIPERTTLEVPYWFAKRMYEINRAQLHPPKAFSERARNIFYADAKVVNLHRVNPHFYEFGQSIASLGVRESGLIQDVLIKAFRERFRMVMDWADNAMVEPSKLAVLDATERRLLRVGHRARAMLDAWLVEGVAQMKPADMVVTLRKRKLMETC